MKPINTEFFSRIGNFIDSYKEQTQTSPTIYDISAALGIPKSTVSRYIGLMKERGLLESEGRRSLVTAEAKKEQTQTVRVPVLGMVSCGVPKLAEENIEEYVRLPISLFGKGNFYILRANGDSMINAGIYDRDLVLIRQQDCAEPGQIVVALTTDEATLKRYYPEPAQHRIRLQPENDAMEPIYVDDCAVQGVAVKVIKDLE